VSPERFAAIANRVLTPKTLPTLSTAHLHLPMVSVAAEATHLVGLLRRQKSATFRTLISDAPNTLVVVARFLALLELYREAQIRFEQVMALGELQITWTGSEAGEVNVSDEFDQPIKLEGEGQDV
jgi:segregation and condensation protein A